MLIYEHIDVAKDLIIYSMLGHLRLLQRIWLISLTSIGLSSVLHDLSKSYGPGPGLISLAQMQLAWLFQQVMLTL